MHYDPHDYQIKAIEAMVKSTGLGLFLDPGLGKTSITLSAFDVLESIKEVKNMLVICPLRPLYSTWPEEIAKWADFHRLSYCLLHGQNKDDEFKKAQRNGCHIYLINPEGMIWLANVTKRFKAKSKFPFDMLVVDESTRFKHTSTQRFKKIKPMLASFKRRYILTGSPAPNGLIDLFGQMLILDRGESLGKYVTHYRQKYFQQSGYGGYTWSLRQGSERRIYKKLADRVIRMDQKDYLDLPELNYVDHWIDLPPSVWRMYKELQKEFILELKTGMVTAANAAVKASKLLQVANGGVYLEDGSYEHLHFEKAKVVASLVEELSGQQALISYAFKHDRERIHTHLRGILKERGESFSYIGSGVTSAKACAVVKGWQNGEISTIVGHPSSVAHGLNLQSGRAVIFHSLTWNLEEYDQFIRRVWRQGQKERVFVHRILAKGTIDETVIDALDRKGRTQTALLDVLREKFLDG